MSAKTDGSKSPVMKRVATPNKQTATNRENTDSGDRMPNSDDAPSNAIVSTAGTSKNPIRFECEEINKRAVGRAILKWCGNQGCEDIDDKLSLRRLLQAIISHLDEATSVDWKNAEVKIYDEDCDVYSIVAGEGKALFAATFDGDDNPRVIETKRPRAHSQNKKAETGGCMQS